jgi:hypothetical protein
MDIVEFLMNRRENLRSEGLREALRADAWRAEPVGGLRAVVGSDGVVGVADYDPVLRAHCRVDREG